MSKAKLFEYCQAKKIPSPLFFSETIDQQSTSILTLILDPSDPASIFHSRSSFSNKKKAENDVSEVCLEFLAKRNGAPAIDRSGGESCLGIDKAVRGAWPGVFNGRLPASAEFLILFPPGEH
jgi:hypothetical protein